LVSFELVLVYVMMHWKQTHNVNTNKVLPDLVEMTIYRYITFETCRHIEKQAKQTSCWVH